MSLQVQYERKALFSIVDKIREKIIEENLRTTADRKEAYIISVVDMSWELRSVLQWLYIQHNDIYLETLKFLERKNESTNTR